MKKLLILGAGIYQVPLIKKAQEMGIYTIVTSIPGNYPGFAIADKVYYENTTDYEAILKIARDEKIECLKQLGRYGDCAAFITDEIAKADAPWAKTDLYAKLSDFYVWNAARYFSDPDKATLEKAAEAMRKATENPADYRDKRRYPANLVMLADLEWKLGRKVEARAALDKAEEFEKKVSADVAGKCGDFAFAEGDYAAAADFWLPVADKWRWEKRVNLVRALYAAGRKAEAEPHLEFLSKNGNKYVRTFYAYALEQYRKEAKK